MNENKEFKPYIPAEKVTAEMTVTSVLMGVILAIVFGAANAYLGLRVGMTVSASIPAAVISMGVIRVIMKKNSILESNMVQTIGSAGESLAAGAIFTMPALFLWAEEGLCDKPSLVEITLIALCGGVLGVLVDDQVLAVVQLHLVLDEIAKEGGEQDGAGHTALGEEKLLGTGGNFAASCVGAGDGDGDVQLALDAHGGVSGSGGVHLAVKEVAHADEARDKGILGLGVDVTGGADLHDVAVLHDGDPVGDGEGFLLIVGDVDGGDAQTPLQLLDDGAHLHSQLGVQITQRLVHQQNTWLDNKSSGQSHTLLLTAGQFVGLPVCQMGDLHQFQRLVHLGAVLVVEQTKPSGVRIAACSRHIPAGHQLRPHMLGEQHGHRARKITLGQGLQRFAVQIHRTADERQLTNEAFEDGRFTRAIRTDER